MKKFTDKINESVEDTIPSAEDWLSNHKELSSYDVAYHDEGGYQGVDENKLYKIMIEFAKLHVEAALKAASEKVELSDLLHEFIEDSWEGGPFIDKDTILNAYPTDNIK
jgi:hypothetical protein